MPWELSESLWKNDTDFYLVLFSVYFLCLTNPSEPRREDGVTNFSNDTDFYLVLFSVYFLCLTNPSRPRREDGVTVYLTAYLV